MAGLLLIPCLLLPPPQEGAVEPAGSAAVAAAMHLPVQPPASPFRHFRLEARLRFTLPGGKVVEQRGRAILGGPARLRYEVGDGQRANVFLLADPGHAWVRPAGAGEWREYDAAVLARECWLRWTVLRLPWELREVLDRPREEAEGGERRLEFTGPGGETGRLLLGPDHLPRRLELGPSRVELGNWRPLRDGRLVPHRWRWAQGDGSLEEHLELVEPGVLFLERAFRPPATGPEAEEDWSARVLAPGGAREGSREEIALVRRPATAVLRGPWPGDWAVPLREADLVLPGVWQQVDAAPERRAVVLLRGGAKPGSLPPGVVREELGGGAWLRWSQVADLEPAAALARLAEVARANGLTPRGPGLVLKTRQLGWMEALLPVAAPAR